MDDDAPYAILGAISAPPSRHGSHIILELSTTGDPLVIAIPVGELPAMVALLAQTSGQAHAIAGTEPDQILETVDSEVFHDQQHLDIHFRLSSGLDLPIGMTLQCAGDLRDKLAASLVPGSEATDRVRQ